MPVFERVEPFIPACPPHPKGGQPVASDRCSRPMCLYRALVSSGMLCPESLELAAPSMTVFAGGRRKAFSRACGKPNWLSTTNWQALVGIDKAAMVGESNSLSPEPP